MSVILNAVIIPAPVPSEFCLMAALFLAFGGLVTVFGGSWVRGFRRRGRRVTARTGDVPAGAGPRLMLVPPHAPQASGSPAVPAPVPPLASGLP